MRDCLVTVTDSAFLPGTETLLYSFLKHNPWFSGALIVFQEGLSREEQNRLSRLGPVEFRGPGPRLQERVAAVVAQFPDFAPIQRRFLALDVFGLEGFDRAVYVDSDILCLGSMEPLFRSSAPLVACPDQFGLRQPSPQRDLHAVRYYGRLIEGSFNAGVLSVGASYLNPRTHLEVLAAIDPVRWQGVDTSLSIMVQLVANMVFEGKVTLADPKYNFLIPVGALIAERTGLTFAEIVQMHFVAVPKPWHETEWPRAVQANPALGKFYNAWQAHHRECQARR